MEIHVSAIVSLDALVLLSNYYYNSKALSIGINLFCFPVSPIYSLVAGVARQGLSFSNHGV